MQDGPPKLQDIAKINVGENLAEVLACDPGAQHKVGLQNCQQSQMGVQSQPARGQERPQDGVPGRVIPRRAPGARRYAENGETTREQSDPTKKMQCVIAPNVAMRIIRIYNIATLMT